MTKDEIIYFGSVVVTAPDGESYTVLRYADFIRVHQSAIDPDGKFWDWSIQKLVLAFGRDFGRCQETGYIVFGGVFDGWVLKKWYNYEMRLKALALTRGPKNRRGSYKTSHSLARRRQNYTENRETTCGNCRHRIIAGDLKPSVCGIGKFSIRMSGVCRLWESEPEE
jgi:hypothetical protein